MILCDTHTHLYLDDYNDDRDAVISRSLDAGVNYLFLPDIDSSTTNKLHQLCDAHPNNCFPMAGLHPTSVKASYKDELHHVEKQLDERKNIVAIGEVGIDLYWDDTFRKEQEISFRHQIELALQHALPIVIHSRNSTQEIINILNDYKGKGLRGVFHCYSGSLKQAEQICEMGFFLGIGGVLTFKNASIRDVVKNTGLQHLLLETDSPFLTPVPYRGKRNESSYIRIINTRLAEIKGISEESCACQTSKNAMELFNVDINIQ